MGAHLAGSDVIAEADVTPDVDIGLRVLVIDSPGERRHFMAHILQQAGQVTVVGYADGPVSALEAVGRHGANAAVLEIQLPIAQGLDTISALREEFPALAIIVCSFHGQATTRQAALDRGADGYLVKPVRPTELHALLRSALDHRSGRTRP